MEAIGKNLAASIPIRLPRHPELTVMPSSSRIGVDSRRRGNRNRVIRPLWAAPHGVDVPVFLLLGCVNDSHTVAGRYHHGTQNITSIAPHDLPLIHSFQLVFLEDEAFD